MPLVWKFPLPYGGDAWAALADQSPVPVDRRLRVNAGEIRWSAVAYDGVGPTASPIDDNTTIDMRIVKIHAEIVPTDPPTTVERNTHLASLVEKGGGLSRLRDYSETDVAPADKVALGIVSVTQDTAAAVWLFAHDGLEEPWA